MIIKWSALQDNTNDICAEKRFTICQMGQAGRNGSNDGAKRMLTPWIAVFNCFKCRLSVSPSVRLWTMGWDAARRRRPTASSVQVRTFCMWYALRPLKRLRLIALLRLRQHLHYTDNDVVRDLSSTHTLTHTPMDAPLPLHVGIHTT